MKILTILGTRPEIIRLSRIIKKLDKICDHKILHTGQNYDKNLNDIFFSDLDIRLPDVVIDNKETTVAEQIANTLVGVEKFIKDFRPDKVLVLGDTNSGLSAVICEKMNIPVYHMEAGNRCYDLSVPEEKNRKIIDAVSSINLPYTELSRQNLLREGVPNNKIFVTGNPIKEVLDFYQEKIDNSRILETLSLKEKSFIIATAHRAENVDNKNRLKNIIEALIEISKDQIVVFSCHPRTKQKLESLDLSFDPSRFKICEPFGFFDFVKLEKASSLAITDSGTVQEEMCIFKIPTITIRETTERPETVFCGSNIISGVDKDKIVDCYNMTKKSNNDWSIPTEYLSQNTSDTVINIICGK